jgi:hypothetical protein
MPVSVGLRAFRPASSFVSWDTDAARNPLRFIPQTVDSKTKTASNTFFRNLTNKFEILWIEKNLIIPTSIL